MSSQRSTFRVAAVVFGVLTAGATAVAPAHADGGNDAFLNALSGAGVQYGDPNAAASLGQSICPMLAKPGGSFAEAASSVNGGGISPGMANLFTTIAISMYCPTMINQMAAGDFSGIGNLAGLAHIPGLSGF
jgi:hypothetical protein